MTTSLMVSSDWFISLFVDVSLKVLLLAVLAGAGMWLLRVRATSVRHRVWTAVLVGMLVMPVLVAWSPTVPLPSWAYPDLRSDNGQELAADDNISAPIAPTIIAEEAPMREPAAAPKSVATAPAPAPAAIEVSSTPPTVVLPAPRWTDRLSELLVVCYALGVAFFGGRLLVGLVAARRLVRSARPSKLSADHAAGIGRIRVLESSQVRVPLTVGWLRPAIVLPSDWSSWSDAMLAAVLAHEQAHVRRHDPWVALAAQVNRAIYWFHPLAWFLARRLTTLAEQACDDAVIESLGDRPAYARHLLTIAGRLTGQPRRLQPIGVAMAARPAVEHRIEAILDTKRPLARRVGWLGTLIMLAVITPAVLLAAGITADKGNPEVGTEPPVVLASTTGSLLLTVLDDNDQPVPGANVKVRIRQVFMGPDSYTHHHADETGRLKIDVPKSTPHYFSASVALPGYAPFLAEWENREAPDPIPAEYTVRLDPGRTIGGIVHDAKGQPIEGVTVAPFFNVKLREERTYQMGAGTNIKTNAAGRWTYASLPTDIQQLPITFEHPGYVEERVSEPISKLAISAGQQPSLVTVLRRGITFGGRVTDADGKPFEGATARYYQQGGFSSDSPEATTDGAGLFRFTCGEAGESVLTISAPNHAPAMGSVEIAQGMEPIDFQLTRGKPLRVRVVDSSETPLAGAYISFWNWDEQGVFGSIPDSRGKTDSNGIWQWSHAPEGLLQFAVSHEGHRDIPGEPLTPGEDNVIVMLPETPVETRVLKILGNVIDAETGSPIARFRVTPGYQREAGGRTYWLHDGQSRGRDGVYRREFTRNQLGSETYAVTLRVEADGYAPGTVQWVVADQESHTADVALSKAAENSFRVLTPTGEPAAGATVAICTPDLGPIIDNGIVADYSPCERAVAGADGQVSIAPQTGLYGLMVVHDAGAAYASPGQLAQSRTITLEPWARVEGILRMRGQAAANEQVTLSLSEVHQANMPIVHYSYKTKTDEEGRFAFGRVVPGNGQVARVALSQLGGGMTRLTPTHVTNAKFPPGVTTHVEVGRAGRRIVGKLLMPSDAKPGNDWRLAMVSLQWNSPDTPKPPKVPYPLSIDPQKDQDAAKIWWEQWRYTDEGKQYQQDFKRFAEASREFKPVHYMARVEPDGTFAFDDMPRGDCRLTIRASAATATVLGGLNEVIATLEHSFTIPDAEQGGADAKEPVDLGELTLKALKQPEPQTEAEPAGAAVDSDAGSIQVVRGRVVRESDGSAVAGADVPPAETAAESHSASSETNPGGKPVAATSAKEVDHEPVLSGRITDESGAPVTDATVDLTSTQARKKNVLEHYEVKTDEQGRYQFDKIDAAGEFSLQITSKQWVGFTGWKTLPRMNLTPESRVKRDFTLPLACQIGVSVVDEAGNPVENAQVYTASLADDRSGNNEGINTSKFGLANIGGLKPSAVDYIVGVYHQDFGYAKANVSLREPGAIAVEKIVLSKGVDVPGVALCSDGKPAAGWKVYAMPSWWHFGVSTRGADIGPEGTFTLTHVVPGRYDLEVNIPEGGGISRVEVALAGAKLPPDDGRVELHLHSVSPQSMVAIAGKIRYLGQEPPNGFWIFANSMDRQIHASTRVEAGAKEFRIAPVPRGTYRVSVEDTRIEPVTISDVAAPTADLQLQVRAIGQPELRGTVVRQADDEPVARFRARVEKLRTLRGPNYVQEPRWYEVDDASGQFTIEVAGPGIYRVLVAADGFAWTRSAEVNSDEDACRNIRVELAPGATLTGTVVNEQGEPIDGVAILPLSKASGSMGRMTTQFATRDGEVKTVDGEFTLENLMYGKETLKVSHPDYGYVIVENIDVPAAGGRAKAITLARGGTVKGQVFDPQGKPQANVTLLFQDNYAYSGGGDDETGRLATAVTDSDGSYEVHGLPEQLCYVQRQEEWTALGVVRSAIFPKNGVTRTLDLGGTTPLTGRLLVNGQPFANARLQLGGENPNFGVFKAFAQTTGDGSFTFWGPPAGEWTLYYMLPGRRSDWGRIQNVEVTGGELNLGTIDCTPAQLAVRVSGGSVSEAGAYDLRLVEYNPIWPHGNQAGVVSPAGVDGEYVIENVPAGAYELICRRTDGLELRQRVEVRPGASKQQVTLEWPPGKALVGGEYHNADGRPRFVNPPNLWSKDRRLHRAVTGDNDNRYRIENLPAGDYYLTDKDTRDAAPAVEFSLADGEKKTLDLTPDVYAPRPFAGAALRLMIFTDQGMLLPGCDVTLTGPGGRLAPHSSQNGQLTFVGAPGTYQLTVQYPGFQTVEREVELKRLVPGARSFFEAAMKINLQPTDAGSPTD